jgi:hypothetical protein
MLSLVAIKAVSPPLSNWTRIAFPGIDGNEILKLSRLTRIAQNGFETAAAKQGVRQMASTR